MKNILKMNIRESINLEICATTFFACSIVFCLTRNTYSILNRIALQENDIVNIKERINDLELFKLKIYNNEIVPGRRAWDEFLEEEDEDEEID